MAPADARRASRRRCIGRNHGTHARPTTCTRRLGARAQILNAVYAEIEKVTRLIGVNAGDLRQVFFIEYVDLAFTARKSRVRRSGRLRALLTTSGDQP